MDPHAQPSDRPAKVVIDAAFKAAAPARYARLRKLGPIHPAEFQPGLPGWVVVGHDLARAALTHPSAWPLSRTQRHMTDVRRMHRT
ncbi:hypothetical protein [Kitasatospora sp. NPDC001683]